MTKQSTVSVIIPTIGRSSLYAAVESALNQTAPPLEVIVVQDGVGVLDLSESDEVRVIRTPGGLGAAMARHHGVSASRGDIVALLDDDDVWCPNKLESQLRRIPPASSRWILSSRYTIRSADGKEIDYPRRLIGPNEPVADYLFAFGSPRFGGASLQTSTLVFPRSVVEAVPLSSSAGSIHDDPHWLLAARRRFPELQIIQLAESLVGYGLTADSVSRSTADRTSEYIRWGIAELGSESPRARGDYFLTSPVAAAVATGSLPGVLRSVAAGVRNGRPGVWALVYAAAATARVSAHRARELAGRVPIGRRR